MNLELPLARWTQSSPRTGGVLVRLNQSTIKCYTRGYVRQLRKLQSGRRFRSCISVAPNARRALIMGLLFG